MTEGFCITLCSLRRQAPPSQNYSFIKYCFGLSKKKTSLCFSLKISRIFPDKPLTKHLKKFFPLPICSTQTVVFPRILPNTPFPQSRQFYAPIVPLLHKSHNCIMMILNCVLFCDLFLKSLLV